ncbi:hypothetical protein CULT_210040 [[Clostridium] ultunense Esp]|nr:hypothetical protein CULT_210040 [[Clostridium] ultunense Esp]
MTKKPLLDLMLQHAPYGVVTTDMFTQVIHGLRHFYTEPMNTPFLMRTGILFMRIAKFMELRRISNIFALALQKILEHLGQTLHITFTETNRKKARLPTNLAFFLHLLGRFPAFLSRAT